MSDTTTTSRFVQRADAILDTKTGLIWAATDLPDELTWEEAKKASEATLIDGEPGRLPTHDELRTLVDLSRHSPAADPVLGLKSGWYWSSTPLASSPDYAWFVYFYGGTSDCSYRCYGGFVRAVRSARASQ